MTSKKPNGGAKKAPKKAPKTDKQAPQSRLAVLVDQKPLPDDEARTLWQEFSRHMDEHEGDIAGFAKLKGWSSVKPEHRQGRAVLVVTS